MVSVVGGAVDFVFCCGCGCGSCCWRCRRHHCFPLVVVGAAVGFVAVVGTNVVSMSACWRCVLSVSLVALYLRMACCWGHCVVATVVGFIVVAVQCALRVLSVLAFLSVVALLCDDGATSSLPLVILFLSALLLLWLWVQCLFEWCSCR